jgi:hypothetical protein
MEPSTNRRSCFVIAPVGAPVSSLLEVLRKSRFEPFFISDFLTSRQKESSKVRAAFKSVDVVVALFFTEYPLENVFFELGIAIGLARPTIVFAEPTVRLPDAFGGIQIRRANLAEPNQLVPEINRFLEPKSRSQELLPIYDRPIRKISEPHPRRERLLEALRGLQVSQSARLSDASLQQELTNVFTNAGATVVQAPHHGTSRSFEIDLALWVDDIQKEIGNPVVVEVKSRLSQDLLGAVKSRLAQSLGSVGATAGIIVHGGQSMQLPDHVAQSAPLIFVFSVDELATLLQEQTLANLLKSSWHAARARSS